MIRVVHPGSRIRMLTFYPSRIPDPGVKKAPDPGSGSATLELKPCCWIKTKIKPLFREKFYQDYVYSKIILQLLCFLFLCTNVCKIRIISTGFCFLFQFSVVAGCLVPLERACVQECWACPSGWWACPCCCCWCVEGAWPGPRGRMWCWGRELSRPTSAAAERPAEQTARSVLLPSRVSRSHVLTVYFIFIYIFFLYKLHWTPTLCM
jgi:hypothetical protein